LLKQSLLLQDTIGAQIRELEGRMKKEHEADPSVQLLRTVPGLGPILSAVVTTEIDRIERFNRADKLCAYAGLVPTTYASGGHIHHGCLLPFCNKWLRWAFVEASWTAIACSAYFGSIYQGHRARGKKANTAIMAVARRMCQISWAMLRERRGYHKVPPAKIPSPVAPAPI
jgi:transposase